MVSCPNCGARNATAAAWCTQCFAPLGQGGAGVQPDPQPDPQPDAEEPPVSRQGGRDGAAAAADPDAAGRDIRQRDGEVEWRCDACETWQPLGLIHCGTCGTVRTGFGYLPRTARVRATPTTALVVSVVLPGLGHLLLGAIGAGIARLVLWAVWIVGGIGLVLEPASRGIGGVLVVGALALWLASLVGVWRLGTGEPDPVGTRMLAVGVGAVTLLMVLVAVAAAFGSV